ncbi:MAG TPA: 4-alpha-glucanotransferase [Acetobacteraceae bacterium]|nr:4-alpha-glucanotransferase [Acetobacteraceae bacterium]
MTDEVLNDLARRAGIAVEWNNFSGEPKVVAPDVLRRILDALGLPTATRGDLLHSRKQLQRRSTVQALPPLITATAGRPTRLDVGAGESQMAQLRLENGAARDVSLMPVRGRLRVPAVSEAGYHRLQIDGRELVLAVAPSRCHTIDDAVPDARLWGIATQVYALCRPGDGGIGDVAGVAALAQAAGARGADALALSPLHALFGADPSRFGPYAPSSRLFLNPLHASAELVFGRERVTKMLQADGFAHSFEELEAARLIDWPAAAKAKVQLFRALFDSFIEDSGDDCPLHLDFASFRADRGQLLLQHAVFETLHAVQSAAGVGDWRQWSADLRDPDSAAVAVFAASHEHEVMFHCFLQWIADRSLRAAQDRAHDAGMRIGLIGDLAVGMDRAGSHAWSRQSDILGGLSIGAPPDLFNPRGQDWGLTSFSPRALIGGGFAAFIATLRAVLRNMGGVRIDHAMGLTRLWLVPEGADPADGAYLAYPLTDLLRLLALESQRHRAIVIGEDLGTVPEGFRATLETAGVHGMRVLWFERNGQGFAAPGAWDHSAVAMTSTHDLPTVAGWWHGSDITTRAACGRLGVGVNEEDLADERNGDRNALWRAFVANGKAQGDAPPPEVTEPVVDAALSFVSATPSPLCLPPIEDLLGIEQQPNLPGTVDEHPNWRRRLAAHVDAVLDEPDIAQRVERLAVQRPRL